MALEVPIQESQKRDHDPDEKGNRYVFQAEVERPATLLLQMQAVRDIAAVAEDLFVLDDAGSLAVGMHSQLTLARPNVFSGDPQLGQVAGIVVCVGLELLEKGRQADVW